MNKESIKTGKHVKVFLKGESSWAIIEKIISPTKIRAKIDNRLVCSNLHGLNYGGIAEFELKEMVKGHFTWEHSSE